MGQNSIRYLRHSNKMVIKPIHWSWRNAFFFIGLDRSCLTNV